MFLVPFMSLELSSRQWRALAAVYHLYAAGMTVSDEEEAASWVEGVLPLLQRAFPRGHDGRWEEWRRGRGSRQKRRRPERWRQMIPDELDLLFSDLLTPSAAEDDTEFSLTTRERTLLRLLNKEQRRADQSYQQLALLQRRVRREGERLINMCTEYNSDHDHEGTLNESHQNHDGGCVGLEKNGLKPPASSNAKRVRCETSSTALGGCSRHAVAGDLLDSEDAMGAMSSPRKSTVSNDCTESHAETPKNTALMTPLVDLTCAGCGEKGGEIFQCRHCLSLRHEACGGPRLESDTGFCRVCSHELGLSFSSGSLRSSTSTEERAELGEDDDDSSLSGFIVNSSEESESPTTPSSSSSSSSSSTLEEEEKLLLPAKKQKKRPPRRR